jgi:hypothetical protein
MSGRNAQRGAEAVEEILSAGGRAQFVAAHLDGSAAASHDLAAEAAGALGGRIGVRVNAISPGGGADAGAGKHGG